MRFTSRRMDRLSYILWSRRSITLTKVLISVLLIVLIRRIMIAERLSFYPSRLLPLALCLPSVAGWGLCTDAYGYGHEVALQCLSNTSKSSCGYGCEWFDFGWVIAMLTISSLVAVVALYWVWELSSEVKRMKKKASEASDATARGGDDTTPLLDEPDEPRVPQGGAWNKVGL